MKGILFAILAGALFACYQLAIKSSADHIQEIAGAVILQGAALIVGSLFFLLLRDGDTVLISSNTGLYFAILAGVFVGLAEIASFYALAQHIAPSLGITLIVGSNILVGLLLDYFFYKSTFTSYQLIGIVLILIGVLLITLDSK